MTEIRAVKFPFGDRILYPDVDLGSWCNRWSLTVFDGKCAKCGRVIRVDRPFASDGVRGLIGRDGCECGAEWVPFCFALFCES